MMAGALVLVTLFFLPIWEITLLAPQYPQGISMYIWINKITGSESGTLQNINILNHYVGMQMIEPDSIPELKYFQFVILGFTAAGIVLTFMNRKYYYLGWVILLIIAGILGIYDFYLWEYDYGHNLSSMAPIKVPGMAYQPPLFGKKMLLNFTALSYPSWGSVSYALAIILGFLAFVTRRKQKNLPHENLD